MQRAHTGIIPQHYNKNASLLDMPFVSCHHLQVTLHEAENAWKPRKLGDDDEEENEISKLERSSRAILNKLTPQKFDKLVQQFKELEIDTIEKLKMCIELVFEKV